MLRIPARTVATIDQPAGRTDVRRDLGADDRGTAAIGHPDRYDQVDAIGELRKVGRIQASRARSEVVAFAKGKTACEARWGSSGDCSARWLPSAFPSPFRRRCGMRSRARCVSSYAQKTSWAPWALLVRSIRTTCGRIEGQGTCATAAAENRRVPPGRPERFFHTLKVLLEPVMSANFLFGWGGWWPGPAGAAHSIAVSPMRRNFGSGH